MEIRISKPGRTCAVTERPFQHGEIVVSAIRIENQQFVRNDYAKDEWNAELAAGALAVWETQYIDPAVAEQQPPEAFSPLRQLFYDAADSTERVVLAKAYLAAQLLRRQKVFKLLKEADSEEGDSRVSLFLDRIGNRIVEVRDPSLSYAELEAGRVGLMDELQALETPVAAETGTGKNGDEQS